ncbi:MBL fold metallo-hydrolase RNA specificity domain-containing protein [Turneriella parva]|uniref:RNA-metabolising metallo-beta-lactamase n=1 Tax=Turneriella parva (strain ATCC BAA-1111 / DSM 21527 / NCTC 11395 / H) TaxID=869212 RepID=I4B4J1_TURPD|nr:MBL fold metallo-hydrolase [Turneriella parva]AFM12198.1 RNA-metabolising metallo-beta-lactamase [Turneriella parva DSM 21527]
MKTSIQFLGGAGTVTGSKYLVRHNGQNILVDCGLFQGLKTLRVRNWNPLPINIAEIDAVVLTHAHVDHSGYIPRLIKDGFRGKIYASEATFELCKILLPDSGYLMEEEAAYLNKRKKTKHSPALPLFTQAEAEDALRYFTPVPFNSRVDLGKEVSFELAYAGHILGAAQIILQCGERKIAFTGDIGRMQDALLYPPARLPGADYLVVESTYGNRLHKETNLADKLEEIILETHARGGVIIIPAFAVGRAQVLMYHLSELRKAGRIPEFPMYLNSPMAESASDLLMKFRDLHRLSVEDCEATCNIVKYIHTPEHSRWLNDQKGPMLIISASGMLTGGRVLHHIKAFAGDERNVILLTGYQAAGTRGEALQRGAEQIKIHGDYVTIRAQVRELENISAHADYGEIISWLESCNIGPRRVFVTHGEPVAADDLRRRLIDKFGWHAMVPDLGQLVELA